jgi:hypothetical protein
LHLQSVRLPCVERVLDVYAQHASVWTLRENAADLRRKIETPLPRRAGIGFKLEASHRYGMVPRSSKTTALNTCTEKPFPGHLLDDIWVLLFDFTQRICSPTAWENVLVENSQADGFVA